MLLIFLVLAVIYVVHGSSKGPHFGVADLVPSDWGLVVSGILPVLVFRWLGLETHHHALRLGPGGEEERCCVNAFAKPQVSAIVATLRRSS